MSLCPFPAAISVSAASPCRPRRPKNARRAAPYPAHTWPIVCPPGSWAVTATARFRTPAPRPRLAQTGLRFLNHFACAPRPPRQRRATLLTGRNPPCSLADAGGRFPRRTLRLSKALGGRGYTCATADSAAAAKSLDQQPAGKPLLPDRRLRSPAPALRRRAAQVSRPLCPGEVLDLQPGGAPPGMPPKIRKC